MRYREEKHGNSLGQGRQQPGTPGTSKPVQLLSLFQCTDLLHLKEAISAATVKKGYRTVHLMVLLTSGSRETSAIFLKSSMETEVISTRLRRPLSYKDWREERRREEEGRGAEYFPAAGTIRSTTCTDMVWRLSHSQAYTPSFSLLAV